MPDDDVRPQGAGPNHAVIDPKRAAWPISAMATIVWLTAITLSDTVSRVVEHWEAAATMLFGSFLAGSSPKGGGAVAFPVFTKVLNVPGPIARNVRSLNPGRGHDDGDNSDRVLIYLASGLLLFPALMVGLRRARVQVFGPRPCRRQSVAGDETLSLSEFLRLSIRVRRREGRLFR